MQGSGFRGFFVLLRLSCFLVFPCVFCSFFGGWGGGGLGVGGAQGFQV